MPGGPASFTEHKVHAEADVEREQARGTQTPAPLHRALVVTIAVKNGNCRRTCLPHANPQYVAPPQSSICAYHVVPCRRHVVRRIT